MPAQAGNPSLTPGFLCGCSLRPFGTHSVSCKQINSLRICRRRQVWISSWVGENKSRTDEPDHPQAASRWTRRQHGNARVRGLRRWRGRPPPPGFQILVRSSRSTALCRAVSSMGPRGTELIAANTQCTFCLLGASRGRSGRAARYARKGPRLRGALGREAGLASSYVRYIIMPPSQIRR